MNRYKWYKFRCDFVDAVFAIALIILILAVALIPVVLSIVLKSPWWLLLLIVTIPLVYAYFNN